MAKLQPRIVNWVNWNVVLKSKSMPYKDWTESVWAKEWGNPIESYNDRCMLNIASQVLDDVMTDVKAQAFLIGMLRSMPKNDMEILKKIYDDLRMLNVRARNFSNYVDMFIVDYQGTYCTIEEYNEIFEKEGTN